MTLRTRLMLFSGALVLIMCAVTATCGVVLRAIQHDARTVAEEYAEVRVIEDARLSLARARHELLRESPDVSAVSARLAEAEQDLAAFVSAQDEQEGADDAHHAHELDVARRVMEAVHAISADVPASQSPNQLQATIRQLDESDAQLVSLSEEANVTVAAAVHGSSEVLSRGTFIIITGCTLGAIAALISGLLQYRIIKHAINTLRDRARSALQRAHVEPQTGKGGAYEDFTEDFTGMVRELESMYDTLEQRVHATSRELVQAERLASVGYLAAGVAHEINNPLSAILGYAELTLRQLESQADSTESVEALEVIRQESLRCKTIVEKLLSLAQRPDKSDADSDLHTCVREVIDVARGMRMAGQREITCLPDNSRLLVAVSDVELKQVLLNLLVNALESTTPDAGRIEISTTGSNGTATFEIRDNGCGMTADEMARIFEPFYSQRSGAPGTGLGLSIVHAIIRDHGGNITVTSDGPGTGSCFRVELPRLEVRHG